MHRLGQRLLEGAVLVALLGLVFVLGGVWLWVETLAPAAPSGQHALFQLVMHVAFGSTVLVIGLHIEHSELPPSDRRAVLLWCYAGFVLLFALSVWGHIESLLAGRLTVAFVSDFVVFTSLGAAFGAIAGVNWGRANRHGRLAQRNREQRETLALLTRLLSHDIRNDLMIVEGHSSLLPEHVGADGESHLDVIRTRTGEIIRLLEDASTLVKTLGEEQEFDRINLSDVLRLEAAHLREEFPAVEIDAEIERDLSIHANNLLHRLFGNLLQNAVFHNDVEGLEITIRAERRDGDVAVLIGDNGTGIDPKVRERCFELGEQGPDSDGDGIGLYLVARLVDLYGGSVTLGESPDCGAEFRMTFPANDATE